MFELKRYSEESFKTLVWFCYPNFTFTPISISLCRDSKDCEDFNKVKTFHYFEQCDRVDIHIDDVGHVLKTLYE